MKKSLFVGLMVLAFGLGAARGEDAKPLKIKYFGHACFLIEFPNGTSMLLDPYDPTLGYSMPNVRPDAVLVSHNHYDHGYIQMAKGEPEIIRGISEIKDWNKVSKIVKGVVVKSVSTHHDDKMGALRGKNTAFIMECQDWRVVHLGDLGHILGQTPAEEFGRVDVLLIPVGGRFTIDAKAANQVVEKLKPKVIIPMHYKTKKVLLPIDKVDPFLAEKLGTNRKDSNVLELSKLPDEQVIYVLDYK